MGRHQDVVVSPKVPAGLWSWRSPWQERLPPHSFSDDTFISQAVVVHNLPSQHELYFTCHQIKSNGTPIWRREVHCHVYQEPTKNEKDSMNRLKKCNPAVLCDAMLVTMGDKYHALLQDTLSTETFQMRPHPPPFLPSPDQHIPQASSPAKRHTDPTMNRQPEPRQDHELKCTPGYADKSR